MSKLPQVKPKDILRAVKKAGFVIKKQRGSHVDLRRPDGRRTSIPMHNKPLGKGLLKAVFNQTELSIEELKTLLK